MAYFSWVAGLPCRQCEACRKLTNFARVSHYARSKLLLRRNQILRTKVPWLLLCSSIKSSNLRKADRVCFFVADAAILSSSTRNELLTAFESLSCLKSTFGRFHYFVVSDDSLEEVERHISLSAGQGLKPEVLITLGGAQVFQLGFREPDPYWEEQVLKEWEPKPVQALVETTLEEANFRCLELRKIYSSEFPLSSMPKVPIVLQYKISEANDTDYETLYSMIMEKLRENGLKANIRRKHRDRAFSVCPSAVKSIGAFEFICSMLNIDKDNSVVILCGDSPAIQEMNKYLKSPSTCESLYDLNGMLSDFRVSGRKS